MTAGKLSWIVKVYEGLIQAGACLDCIEPTQVPAPEDEVLEAVYVDLDRMERAVRKLLKQHNALPEWAQVNAILQAQSGDDIEIPF